MAIRSLLCTARESGDPERSSWIDRRTRVEDLPEFFSVAEFCAFTRLSRSLVYDLIRREEIPHRRFGRRILIPSSALSGSAVR